jgi:predicted dehydrogenase
MTERLRVASVGLGRWAKVIAGAVQRSSHLDLVSCFSRQEAARTEFAGTYACRSAATLEELLGDPGVDALLVTVPNDAHADTIERAARAGKHVFVEKPIAASLEDGLRIARVVAETGVRVMVGHSARMLAGSREIKRMLGAGELGQIALVETNFSNDRALELTPDKWRADPERNPGGPLMQLAVHNFDVVGYLLGPAASVVAQTARLHTRVQVPDVTTALVRLDSGPIAYFGSSWVSAAAYAVRLYGTKANVHLEVDFRYWGRGDQVDAHSVLRVEPNGGDPFLVKLTPADMYRDELDELAAAVRENRPTEVGPEVGLANLVLVHACLRSAEEGREVRLAEVWPSGALAGNRP